MKKWIPKDKQKEPAELTVLTNSQELTDFIDRAKTIPSLSVDRAVAMLGGSVGKYKCAVELMAKMLPGNIAMLDGLLNTDISQYSIEVHGIKRALNRIGAYTLGRAAYKLEILSRNGDTDACREEHPRLIELLSHFLESVTAIVNLEKENQKSDDKVLPLEPNSLIIDYVYAPKANILIVDDNKVNLAVAKTLLELYGIKPYLAETGMEAIELVKEEDFDIVFMDHMMPVMDGIECMQKIRALGGKYETIPIIALTANTEIGIGEMFIKAGMNDFISKPIDKKILNSALAKYIPGEKLEKPASTKIYAAKDTELALLSKVGEIGEIDTKLGLSRVAERADAYIKNLDIFIRNEPKFYTNTIAMISEKDLKAFAILVHGIKGSLTNIGAMGISQLAAQLEMSAKNNDIVFCEENVDAFTEQLKNLREKLAAVLSDKEEKLKKERGETSVLKEKLSKMVSQLDIFDVDGAIIQLDDSITHTYGESVDSDLALIRNQIDDYQYDLAIETIKTILNVI